MQRYKAQFFSDCWSLDFPSSLNLLDNCRLLFNKMAVRPEFGIALFQTFLCCEFVQLLEVVEEMLRQSVCSSYWVIVRTTDRFRHNFVNQT